MDRNELDSGGKGGGIGGQVWWFLKSVGLLFRMLLDYGRGRYRRVPWWVFAAVAFVLLFALSPFGMIPVLGELDDAAVVFICLKMLDNELLRYAAWRKGDGDEA